VKVVVVGGSVAGLHTAHFLLSSGLDCEVSVVERKKAFGENIVCAGGIASYMIKKLKLQVPSEFVARRVNKVRFYSPGLDYADLELHKEYGLILWRDRWENWLGEQVMNLGAKAYLNVKDPLEFFKDADVVVGADGIAGVTRKLAGRPFLSSDDVHIAVQAVGRAKIADEEAISMYFGSQVAPKGYGWSFPIGGSLFRIGLGVPLTYSSKLMEFFKRLLTSIEAELSEKPRVKMIPTAPPEKTLVGEIIGKPVAFVGDAGLQTDPSTGGGIAPAILGARCLSEALNMGDLKLYDKLWRGELYRRNRQRYGLKQVLCELSDGEWEMLVDLLKDFRPMSESIGLAMVHLLVELAFRNPRFLTKHKVLRRLLASV
jgi:digeranylgeranylglycerophospholipid reductase